MNFLLWWNGTFFHPIMPRAIHEKDPKHVMKLTKTMAGKAHAYRHIKHEQVMFQQDLVYIK